MTNIIIETTSEIWEVFESYARNIDVNINPNDKEFKYNDFEIKIVTDDYVDSSVVTLIKNDNIIENDCKKSIKISFDTFKSEQVQKNNIKEIHLIDAKIIIKNGNLINKDFVLFSVIPGDLYHSFSF